MNRRLKNKGFSLTEVLLAAGILVIGFMLIAGTLPVGIKLTAMGTERTIGAVATDEAFAKVQLFGISDPNFWSNNLNGGCVDYIDISILNANSDEFSYPSTDVQPDVKKYHWAAMFKCSTLPDTFQVTVFVSRDTGLNTKYPDPAAPLDPNPLFLARYPRPVPVPVEPVDGGGNVIAVGLGMWTDRLRVATGFEGFITDESVLLDDRTGQIMRVLKRGINDPTIITLEDALFYVDAAPPPRYIWVIPPAKGSGRYPGVSVYQRNWIKLK
ncbi:MAG: hypothetical protein J7M40_02155 [Planctomycetes bacterium]|nr:hypothetical protein [Planctomycetota bacterium]